MAAGTVVLLTGVVKSYGGLRPLRIASLVVTAGERVALGGIDAAGAEVLINLITGAALPDEGRVDVAGTDTAAIVDGDAWLASLDRFGIVSQRAVLLEGATLLQNLSLPLTLEIEAIAPEVRRRVEALASEAGLPADRLAAQVAAASGEERARAQLARALALDPEVLLLEHPTITLPRPVAAPFGRAVAAVVSARGITALAITEDAEFAKSFASRWLRVDAASGAVQPARKRWLL